MGTRKLSFTTRYVLLVGILLLVANTVLGIVSFNRSKDTMRALIEKDMLDIVNSAAGSLDGDTLGALTADDVGGPAFKEISRVLLVFQNSTDIQFIYAVKRTEEGTYVFTVDPDPVDPGEFGEEVLVTPALIKAANGTAAVDDTPAADEWGNFYSAYCPVFDSTGKVAGVVGVDFDTQWYQDQVTNNIRAIAAITSLSVLLASIVVGLITSRVRAKFHELDKGLSELSDNVDVLMGEMASYSGFDMPEDHARKAQSADAQDEIEALGHKIHTMQNEMKLYLDYLRTQAYTDALTKVSNSSAYHEKVNMLDKQIKKGTADFRVAVIDINGLKELNDTHGHECGDYYIQGTASALIQGFDISDVYRIGGDEFAVIVEGCDEARMVEGLASVMASIEAFNQSSKYPATLAVSRGTACFDAEQDSTFKDVFARADHAMYLDKQEFYRKRGALDRRHASFASPQDKA